MAIVIVLAFEIIVIGVSVISFAIKGVIMLLWNFYKEERDRRRAEKESDKKQSIMDAERANIAAEKTAEKLRSWEEWYARQKKKNIDLDEPPPSSEADE